MRRVRRVVLLLVLGFVINLGVGYACWARVCWFVDVTLYYEGAWTTVTEGVEEGGFRTEKVGRVFGWSGYYLGSTVAEAGSAERDAGVIPSETRTTLEMSFGFPVRTVGWAHTTLHESRLDAAGRHVQTQTDLVARPAWYFGGVGTPLKRWPGTVLPVDVWRAGTLVNTVFYAVVLVVVARAVRRVRGALRRRRGRCTLCGYSVEGLGVCPECGMAV